MGLVLTWQEIGNKKIEGSPMKLILLSCLFCMSAMVQCRVDANDDWQSIGKVGGVETFVKPDDPVTRTKAVKGTMTIAVHISNVLGVFVDASVAPQWVDLLTEMSELRFEQQQCTSNDSAFVKSISEMDPSLVRPEDVEVVHQEYGFPWPLQPRDFVLLRQFKYDAEKKAVDVYYESIEDLRLPPKDGVIRGVNIYSRFYFRATAEGGTYIEVETQVDLKGSLPSFVINQIQKLWPMKTLGALKTVTQKGVTAPLARIADW